MSACWLPTVAKTPLFVEQIGVSACADKVDHIALDLIDQQEVAADVAFPMVVPVALERVIEPFRA